MFCELVLPSFGAKSTEGELIGHGLLMLRAGSPKTRMVATFAWSALVRVVPKHKSTFRNEIDVFMSRNARTMYNKSAFGVATKDEVLVWAQSSLAGEVVGSYGGTCCYCRHVFSACVVCDGIRGRSGQVWSISSECVTTCGNNSYPGTADATAEDSGVPTVPSPTSVVPAMCQGPSFHPVLYVR